MPASKAPRYFMLACMLLMASCNVPVTTQQLAQIPGITATPFQPIIGAQNPEGTVLEEGEVESQEAVANWWISPDLPLVYRELLTLPEGAQVTEDKGQAHLLVSVNEEETISQWVYALVAPFPTLADEVSYADLQAAWQGKGSEPFSDSPLMMSAETEAVFRAWWGQPGESAVRIEGANQLLETAWSSQPAWAIVPFNEVQPKWKMLAVEGQSPIWKTFDIAKYPLSVPIGLSGDPTLLAEALARFGP
jgi:hypothetical protein